MKSHISKESATSEVTLGSLYDINKQLMQDTPSIDATILEQRKEALCTWINKHADQHYFMLLCNDLKDYTIFNIQPTCMGVICINQLQTMTNDVIECMTNRGKLQAIELQDTDAWELWLGTDEGSFAYYLFPYGNAVLEY